MRLTDKFCAQVNCFRSHRKYGMAEMDMERLRHCDPNRQPIRVRLACHWSMMAASINFYIGGHFEGLFTFSDVVISV